MLLLFWVLFLGNVYASEEDNILQYSYYPNNTQIINNNLYFIEEWNLYINWEKQESEDKYIDFLYLNDKFYFVFSKDWKYYLKQWNRKSDLFDNKINLFIKWKDIYFFWKKNDKYFLYENFNKISEWFDEIIKLSFNWKYYYIQNGFLNYWKEIIINWDDVYFVWKINDKYSIYKNTDKISKDLYNFRYLYIYNDYYYINKNNLWEDELYKNNNLLIKAKNIYNIKYNKENKKIYAKFKLNNLVWVISDSEIITSNIIDKNLDINTYKYDFLKDEEEKYYNANVDDKSLTYKLKNNDKYLRIEKLWSIYYKKNSSKLSKDKLYNLSERVFWLISKTNDINKKEILLYLGLEIKNTYYYSYYSELYNDLPNLKQKTVWYEYEPRFYKPDSKHINITKVNKTYDQENNRFILEIESEIDKEQWASAYFRWTTTNWTFTEFSDEVYDKGNWSYSRVYFYPAWNKPIQDYVIRVNGWDNLGYVDDSRLIIKSDEFIYEKVDELQLNNYIKVSENSKYMIENELFSFDIEAYEIYKWEKDNAKNINVYINKINWEEVEEKRVMYSREYESNIRFIPWGYINDYSDLYWKELELEIEVTFEHSTKIEKFNVIYLPQFKLRWKVYKDWGIDDLNDFIFINNQYQSFDNYWEFNYTLPKNIIILEYEKQKDNLDDFKISIELNNYTKIFKYEQKYNYDLTFDNNELYIFIQNNFDEYSEIDIKDSILKDYFDYKSYNNYSDESIKKKKEILDKINSDILEKIKNDKNDLFYQDLYLEVNK